MVGQADKRRGRRSRCPFMIFADLALLLVSLAPGRLKERDTLMNRSSPPRPVRAISSQTSGLILHALRVALRLSLKHFLCPPGDLVQEQSSPCRICFGRRVLSILRTCPDQRSWFWISMASTQLASSRTLIFVRPSLHAANI